MDSADEMYANNNLMDEDNNKNNKNRKQNSIIKKHYLDNSFRSIHNEPMSLKKNQMKG